MLTKEEINEMLQLLERAGWKPLLCDTPVQCYDVQVPAGPPNGIGDPVRLDDMHLPKELVHLQPCYSIIVSGDSMKDVGILHGDRVQFCMDGIYTDGDIVVASMDGNMTLKTYYKDKEGNHWLVPLNEAYSPILLKEEMNVKILGAVELLTRQKLRPSLAQLERIMCNAKERGEVPVPQKQTPQDIILFAAPMIEVAKHWYAVYRANCMSFSKPVCLWREDHAPVTGARFEKYLRIARACLEQRRL